MQPPNQQTPNSQYPQDWYPKTTKYPSSLEPTQAAYSSNYETTEQIHLNPYLNNLYELPSLPPPPPPPPPLPTKSRKGPIKVVIALLCLTIVGTSLFVGYIFIRPELARQTKVTVTPIETPSPIPVHYTAHDIIRDFMQAHLSVYASSTKPDFP